MVAILSQTINRAFIPRTDPDQVAGSPNAGKKKNRTPRARRRLIHQMVPTANLGPIKRVN